MKNNCNDSNSFDECVWFDSNEAAEFLKIDVGTLLNDVSNGKIPYYKVGRRNRYMKSELEKFLRAHPRGERTWESNTTY